MKDTTRHKRTARSDDAPIRVEEIERMLPEERDRRLWGASYVANIKPFKLSEKQRHDLLRASKCPGSAAEQFIARMELVAGICLGEVEALAGEKPAVVRMEP